MFIYVFSPFLRIKVFTCHLGILADNPSSMPASFRFFFQSDGFEGPHVNSVGLKHLMAIVLVLKHLMSIVMVLKHLMSIVMVLKHLMAKVMV